MVTLSSGVGAVTVGLLRLLARVAQKTVETLRSEREELTLATAAEPLREKPLTVRKTKAVLSWAEPDPELPQPDSMSPIATTTAAFHPPDRRRVRPAPGGG